MIDLFASSRNADPRWKAALERIKKEYEDDIKSLSTKIESQFIITFDPPRIGFNENCELSRSLVKQLEEAFYNAYYSNNEDSLNI